MSQIMESKHLHSILLDHLMKIMSDRVWTDELSIRITAYKAFKLRNIIFTTELFMMLIHILLFEKHISDMRNQRKCSSCRVCFQSCLHKELGLSTFVIIAYDLAFDSDSTFLEVD